MPAFSSLFQMLLLSGYVAALLGLSVFSLQAIVLTVLFLRVRRQTRPPAPQPGHWPTVTVQLPLYNERHVALRVIDAVCALDYPRAQLSIQVLDDSTDDTTALVRQRVAHHQQHGVNITHLHRPHRTGFKAGALAAGLTTAPGEFIAIFDADFVPPVDFLQKVLPHFIHTPTVGMVQTRWAHLNAAASPLTRAQALVLDGHFVVEQTARSRSGLLFNFNGSAGVWRRSCIAAAGGWQPDTLSEDLDLSYRAQLAGWQLRYLPEVLTPAEIPPQLAGFKRQQYRWAHGCIQVVRKLTGRLLQSSLTPAQKLGALLHITAYLAYPLLLVGLLCCLPLALLRVPIPSWLGWLSLTSLGPPLLFAVSQWAAYHDWPRRLSFFGILLGVGMGVALNNSLAIGAALWQRPTTFERTPKFGDQAPPASRYALRWDWTLLGECALTLYAATSLYFSWHYAPGLIGLTALFTWGFGMVSMWGLWEGWELQYKASKAASPPSLISERPPQ